MDKSRNLFLLIGQSNMAGRGDLNAVPPLNHPQIAMFRNGAWMPAEEPLHTDKPAIAGIGLGMSFAASLLKTYPGANIGLLPCAFGGTPLDRWMPGEELYLNAVEITKRAVSDGALRGILWHQGEGDSQDRHKADAYGRRLTEMVTRLRADLNAEHAPFIAGELGGFLKNHSTCIHFKTINAILKELGHDLPLHDWVSAHDLKDKGDILHFDAASLREFGRRYAAVYLNLATRHRLAPLSQ